MDTRELPAGWGRYWCTNQKAYYFVNSVTNFSTWDFPLMVADSFVVGGVAEDKKTCPGPFTLEEASAQKQDQRSTQFKAACVSKDARAARADQQQAARKENKETIPQRQKSRSRLWH